MTNYTSRVSSPYVHCFFPPFGESGFRFCVYWPFVYWCLGLVGHAVASVGFISFSFDFFSLLVLEGSELFGCFLISVSFRQRTFRSL